MTGTQTSSTPIRLRVVHPPNTDDSFIYAKNYVAYHALILYRAMLLQTPGGPQILPNYDELFRAIDDQIDTSSTYLNRFVERRPTVDIVVRTMLWSV